MTSTDNGGTPPDTTATDSIRSTASPFAGRLSADFSEVVGKVRPELHSAGFGGQLTGIASSLVEKILPPLRLHASRTHDWALVNPGQRICDTHFVFPLQTKDPANPSNYYFSPTDEILDRTINLLGMNVLYRMGTSIESVNCRRQGDRNPRYYNSVEPEDWTKNARALEGIISHYTEGWANGFHWGDRMGWWELWNEPNDRPGGSWIVKSQDPDRELNQNRFFDFFVFTLKRLKTRFPHLKFGGPAVCFYDEKFLRGLLEKCRAAGYAPDFISWHHYWVEPDWMLSQPAVARRLCDEYGFTDTKLIIDEWHYIPFEDYWGYNGPEKEARKIDPTVGTCGIDSAVFTLQVLMGLQSTCLDQAYFYGCNYGGQYGILKDDTSFNKVYFGLKTFGSALAAGDCIVKTADTKAVRLFGVRSADGAKMALVVTAFKCPACELEVEVKGVPPDASIKTHSLDDNHDLAPVETVRAGDTFTFAKADGHSAAWLVEIG